MLKFTKDHEWLSIDGDVATVGITDHAAEQLGDVVFVELPEVGASRHEGRRGGDRRERQGGERDLRAARGEVSRPTRRSSTTRRSVNADAEGKRLVLQAQARPSRRGRRGACSTRRPTKTIV